MEKKNKKRHLLSLLFALLGCFIMSMSLSSCGYQYGSVASLLKIKRAEIVDVYIKGWGGFPQNEEEKNKIERFKPDVVDTYLDKLLKLKVWTTPNTCKCDSSWRIILELQNETMMLSYFGIGNDRIRYNIKDGGEQFYELTKEYLEL